MRGIFEPKAEPSSCRADTLVRCLRPSVFPVSLRTKNRTRRRNSTAKIQPRRGDINSAQGVNPRKTQNKIQAPQGTTKPIRFQTANPRDLPPRPTQPVILRQRSRSRSERFPTKDLCTFVTDIRTKAEPSTPSSCRADTPVRCLQLSVLPVSLRIKNRTRRHKHHRQNHPGGAT